MDSKAISVLFDLDGTLLDHEAASNAAVIDALDNTWMPGHGLKQDLVLAEWARLETLHMTQYLAGEVDFAEQRRRRLRGLLASVGGDRHMDDQAADELFKAYVQAYEASWTAFPDVAPTVRRLDEQGVDFAILSNGDRQQQLSKVAALELPIEVRVLVPADLGAAKPASDAFTGACRSLGWEPQQVLYVGDNPEVDARASLAAGLSACWVNRKGYPTPFSATEQIAEVQTLHAIFDILNRHSEASKK